MATKKTNVTANNAQETKKVVKTKKAVKPVAENSVKKSTAKTEVKKTSAVKPAAKKTAVKTEVQKTPVKTETKKSPKETKVTLTQFLNDHIKTIKSNKDLSERIAYVAKMWKKDPSKVDITTLRSLKKEVEDIELAATAAASLKKPEGKQSLKKPVAKPAKEEPKPKAEVKTAKKETTKPVPKKSAVVDTHVEGRNVIVDRFADEYETEIGKFTKCSDIKSYKDLAKAVSAGRDVYLMWYIDKRTARGIDYVGGLTLRNLDELSKSWFENDLDVTRVVFISDSEPTIVIAVSEYTDAPFMVCHDEIAPDKKDGVRYSGNLAYEIYELTEE